MLQLISIFLKGLKMYILVRLLKGFPKPLYYKIPDNFIKNNLDGKVVNVPIKNYNVPALVLKTYIQKPKNLTFNIKEINNLQKFPDDLLFHEFIKKISNFYFVKPLYFYTRIRSFLDQQDQINKINFNNNQGIDSNNNSYKETTLTHEQENILLNIKQNILQKNFTPTLIHGVTGSGKTEIYKKLIIENISQNKSVILLLPEVSLAVQFEHLLKKQLPENIKIISFHSASKISEKRDLWKSLLDNKDILIIGVHLPILLPIPNLGLIIIDEEHETGFQEKKYPKINSKELALWRAQFYKIPIVLGSATPSSSSIYNVKNKNWFFYQLTKRFAGKFPEIKLIYLKDIKNKYQKYFWISKQLKIEIENRLLKKEQTLIYINRRGFSFFVQCKNCGFIFECPNCSVSLTLHKDFNNEELLCHYCNYKRNIPTTCPECKQKEDSFLRKGIGTQQAVKILQEIFPNAKIARADMDTTNKKSWINTLQDFQENKIDILVGTQVITKGYHFPKVTLVGILWADLNLHFPIFNASETTLQKLIQVAGRAGRVANNSKVIVQAVQEHDIFNYLNEVNYLDFIKEELNFRELAGFPPYKRLIQIELKNINSIKLDQEAQKLVTFLNNSNQNNNLTILGPAKPAVYKIQKTESRNIFVKASNFSHFYETIKNIDLKKFESSIFITPTQ
jgi:primosomal protein N' (replication factor Y)